MSIPEENIWRLDSVSFASYGVYVSKSSGVLDLPKLVNPGTDWLDENGKSYWNEPEDLKYSDRDIILNCWIHGTDFSDFKTKVAAFYSALMAPGLRILETPYNEIENVTIQNGIQLVRETSYVSSINVGTFTLRLTVAGDSQTKFLGVYRADGEVRQVLKYGNDAKLTRLLQGGCEITLSCEFNSIQTLGRNDYILYGDEKYICLEYPQIDKLSTNKFIYRLTYVNQFFVLKDVQFRITDRSDTPWWATMEDVIDNLITNANRGFSGLFAKGTIDSTENRNHLFQNESCYDVLNRISSEYELEWGFAWNSSNSKIYISVKKHIGESTGLYLSYGKPVPGNVGGLYNLKRVSSGREQMVTRLYAYGSDKNIPASYGYPRLKLATEPLTRDYFGMHIEKTKIFEDIFPERTGHVSGYTYTEAVKIEESIYEMVDASMDFDLKELNVDGSTKYLIAGTTAKIHFNSGDLAGFEFEVLDYNHTTKTFNLIPYKDEQGTLYPNATLFPNSTTDNGDGTFGDEYKILDINPPAIDITNAESRLQIAADAYIDDNYNPKAVYSVETSPGVNPPGDWVGKSVWIVDSDFDISDSFRITEIATNLYKGDGALALAEYVQKSIRQDLSLKVAGLERSLKSAKLNKVETVRANEKTTGSLKNILINPIDEKLKADEIVRTESLDPRMLAFDSGSVQFHLTGLLFEQDGTTPLQYNYSSGTFVHHSYAAKTRKEIAVIGRASYDPTRTWTISASNKTVGGGTVTNVYIKVPTATGETTGTIEISTATIQEKRYDGYLYFLIGQIDNTVTPVHINMLFGNVKRIISTGVNYAVQALSGTTPSWDANSGINATLTLSGNTTITLSNLVAGTSGNIRITNHSTAYTLTVSGYTNHRTPSCYIAASNQLLTSAGGSKEDIFSWYYDGIILTWNGARDCK